MIPYLQQLHTFLSSIGPSLPQEDRLQLYEAIAHVISAMPMESAAQTLRSFSFELLSRVQVMVHQPNGGNKEWVKTVSGRAITRHYISHPYLYI